MFLKEGNEKMLNPQKGRVAFLVTSNIHKFNEARRILRRYEISIAMLKKVDAVEIQHDDIENVAKASALDAVKKCKLPIVVEDAGLFVEALKGFPGPYSSYVYRTISNEGILKLLENVANRNALFKSAVAYCEPSTDEPVYFTGEVKGHIVDDKRGNQGFGFDPIFKPLNSSKTFAEMTVEEKNQQSHRARAFRKFAEWYTTSF
ncbi:MAG: XTP/dITP diphosphatase [Candidatus Bathyarchaeia archaeon]